MLSPSAITTYASAVTASSMNGDPASKKNGRMAAPPEEDDRDREVAVAVDGAAQAHPASRVCSPSSPWGLKTMISTR